MPKIIHPRDEAEWLALRAEDVTSTESPALFGLSPYITAFELWHRKVNRQQGVIDVNTRMVWGRRLEPVIAKGIAEDYGVKIRRLSCYARHDTVDRMGASFDYEIVGLAPDWTPNEDVGPKDPFLLRNMYESDGPGVLEIKAVDYLQFRGHWTADSETKELEAPEHIEVQVQHQLEVLGRKWSAIGLLVSGNTPHVVVRKRDAEVGAKIAEYVAAFWRDVDAGIEPTPDYLRDASLIRELYRDADVGAEPLDLSKHNRVAELCHEYKAASAAEKEAKERKTAAMAELLTIIGPAPYAIGPGGIKISAKTIHRGSYTVDATCYRDVRITMPKGQEAA